METNFDEIDKILNKELIAVNELIKIINNKDKKDSEKKIDLIETIIEIIFTNEEKAILLSLRGEAYVDLWSKTITVPKLIPAEEVPISSVSTTTEKPAEEILELTDARERVLASVKNLNGAIVPQPTDTSQFIYCGSAALVSYSNAKVNKKLEYCEIDKSYTILKKNSDPSLGTTTATLGVDFSDYCGGKQIGKFSTKLDDIQPGDYLIFMWDATSCNGNTCNHGVIFINWIDEEKHIANVFDWNGAYLKEGETDSNGVKCTKQNFQRSPANKDKVDIYSLYNGAHFCKTYHYVEYSIGNGDMHPMYVRSSPYIPSSTTTPTPAEATQETITLINEPKESSPSEPPTIHIQTVTGTTNTTYVPPVRATVRENIYANAMAITNKGSNDTAARFVSTSLKKAGISGLEFLESGSLVLPYRVSNLVSILETKSGFVEVNVNDLKIGDIVVMGKGCTTPYSVGIVALEKDTNQIYIYTNLKNKVELKTLSFNTEISDEVYFYRAFRYTGDTKESVSARTRWTLTKAVEEVNKRTGNYKANKVFVDQLIYDRILTEQECKEVRGVGLFSLQKDMKWLNKLLTSKQPIPTAH